MIKLGELMMILDLHRQGLSVSAVARQTGADRMTVRKYIERGMAAPCYGPRKLRGTMIDLDGSAGAAMLCPDSAIAGRLGAVDAIANPPAHHNRVILGAVMRPTIRG